MNVVTRKIKISSKGHTDLFDITEEMARELKASGLKNGLATVFVPGSTAGVTTLEYEPGLVKDIKNFLTGSCRKRQNIIIMTPGAMGTDTHMSARLCLRRHLGFPFTRGNCFWAHGSRWCSSISTIVREKEKSFYNSSGFNQ